MNKTSDMIKFNPIYQNFYKFNLKENKKRLNFENKLLKFQHFLVYLKTFSTKKLDKISF